MNLVHDWPTRNQSSTNPNPRKWMLQVDVSRSMIYTCHDGGVRRHPKEMPPVSQCFSLSLLPISTWESTYCCLFSTINVGHLGCHHWLFTGFPIETVIASMVSLYLVYQQSHQLGFHASLTARDQEMGATNVNAEHRSESIQRVWQVESFTRHSFTLTRYYKTM